MAEEQLISTGNVVVEALKLIVSGGIGGVIVACIGKLIVDRKLQMQKADIDSNLQKQKVEYDKQVESLRSKLQKKNTVHKLQFEKEFQLYGEPWKALVNVRKTVVITPFLDNNMPKDKAHYDVYKGRFENAVDAFNKAKNLFEDHRPFYHDDVSKITKELLSQCRGHIGSVGRMLKSGNFDDKLCDKAEELLKKVPEAIDEIEKVIKERIGLLQGAEIVE
jgi:tetratricopeptide (TPR) repeat protein